ncbi:hypothetical protein Cgig2_019606 [Carnegiea gigantea]|uniref:H15 domain-containing protein n=1 Tax=Carnegiea gigantea TaxID=171969 RepID=A0A9Q1QJ16_9CARY|nr:hypothetical protein Cgig2_019606 [Carnegiea gigantea]
MSSSGEVDTQAPPVEQPSAQASEAPAEQPVVEVTEETASKEKKPKAPAHPPYFQMIKEAILALNEKGGSSPYAIAKYIEQKYEAVLPVNFRKILGLQLKSSVAKGKLIKIKASYKLSATGKREKRKTATKAARANAGKPPKEAKKKKPKTKALRKIDNSSTPNTVTVMKIKARRSKAAAPAKLKQLRRIKSPVVRKANKASAA